VSGGVSHATARRSPGLLVWILQTGEPLHVDGGSPRPMRAMNTADALVAAGHRVVLWSSAFYHQEKRHRARRAERFHLSPQLEIRLVPSPGYRRNIGPGRLWDHALLGFNLRRLLRQEPAPPDVGFVGYPPIETAAVLTRWLAARGAPCLLDLKDQWPSIFLDAAPRAARPVGRLVLAPYFHLAKRAMTEATGLAGIAEGFLRWGLEVAGRPRRETDIVVPLTSPDEPVPEPERAAARRWWDGVGVKDDGTLRICFVGSHSSGFDFQPIRDAAARCAESGPACQFVICGDGECSAEWREAARSLANVVFPGWIDRPRIAALAERSSAALAPYRGRLDFSLSVPNKVIDSLAFGLPVLSPLPGEVAHLIAAHNVGLRYGPEAGRTLHECVVALAGDADAREGMARSAGALYERSFSFERVYGGLVAHLERLARRARAPSPPPAPPPDSAGPA